VSVTNAETAPSMTVYSQNNGCCIKAARERIPMSLLR